MRIGNSLVLIQSSPPLHTVYLVRFSSLEQFVPTCVGLVVRNLHSSDRTVGFLSNGRNPYSSTNDFHISGWRDHHASNARIASIPSSRSYPRAFDVPPRRRLWHDSLRLLGRTESTPQQAGTPVNRRISILTVPCLASIALTIDQEHPVISADIVYPQHCRVDNGQCALLTRGQGLRPFACPGLIPSNPVLHGLTLWQ
ncbi:unnamed protein product [Acanthosepion pharaonis]|uniref:Uncharacterized protein n=1 Tax=Acanthosepion pharaonis TaxID=158019 RepID=A0A812D4A9_ACAPH|nr:unnamed protein product [Sepia pharaonis]